MIGRLMQLLVPLACTSCGREGSALCRTCGETWRLRVQQCAGCGVASWQGRTCERCCSRALSGVDQLAGVSVALHYDGPVKQAVLDLKFQALRWAAPDLARFFEPLWEQERFDAVTSVPVSPGRYRERGYNQSELLARAVARRSGIPYLPLLARQSSDHQLGLGRAERLRRVGGVFYGLHGLSGERVLVVDDVVTTGATLNECARVLKTAGASTVWGLALARH